MRQSFVFHHHGTTGNEILMEPTYYLDADFLPLAVRVYSESTPKSEAAINIYSDGVSIFEDRQSVNTHYSTGAITVIGSSTTAVLVKGEANTDFAGQLSGSPIEEGSWLTCKLITGGGGKNFTVQLDCERLHSEEEPL